MPFDLPALPFAADALEPHISARTMAFHHGKHHQAYVTNLNNLIQNTPLANASLEEIIRATANDPAKAGIYNNAAQVWNHSFFWNSLSVTPTTPSGELAALLTKDLGGLDGFKEAFKQAGSTQFGSGWAWLVLEGKTLKVTKTPNAANPLTLGQTPLLTCDVWEHAYYLDYQNRRPDFLQTFLDHRINWDFAARNLSWAQNA